VETPHLSTHEWRGGWGGFSATSHFKARAPAVAFPPCLPISCLPIGFRTNATHTFFKARASDLADVAKNACALPSEAKSQQPTALVLLKHHEFTKEMHVFVSKHPQSDLGVPVRPFRWLSSFPGPAQFTAPCLFKVIKKFD
jgi:hypothetical protein